MTEPVVKLLMRHPDITNLPLLHIPEGMRLKTHADGLEACWEDLIEAAFGTHYTFAVSVSGREGYRPEYVFYLEKDGKIISTATATKKDDASGDGLLHMVATAPEARRLGAGRAVILAALHSFQSRGYQTVSLSTDDHRLPAIRLYYSLGFRPVYTHESHQERWAKILPQLQ